MNDQMSARMSVLLPLAELKEEHYNQLQFQLPVIGTKLPAVFRYTRNKTTRCIEVYNQTTSCIQIYQEPNYPLYSGILETKLPLYSGTLRTKIPAVFRYTGNQTTRCIQLYQEPNYPLYSGILGIKLPAVFRYTGNQTTHCIQV